MLHLPTWTFSDWRLNAGEPNCSGNPASAMLFPDEHGYYAGWNDTPWYDPLGGFVCAYYAKH